MAARLPSTNLNTGARAPLAAGERSPIFPWISAEDSTAAAALEEAFGGVFASGWGFAPMEKLSDSSPTTAPTW